jgi:hypothetical protein
MRNILFTILAIALSGCDSDPFGFRNVTIIAPYELEKWETGTHYYLVGPEDKAYGVLEGTVGKIGWNQRYILVWQNGDGLGPGWRVIDSSNKTITPTLDQSIVDSLSHLKGISVKPPKEVWSQLQ